MKRLLPVLLAVLMLLSCSNPLMDGQNSHVNIFIYPYLEFTEEENEVAVSVAEGADVSFISIPSEVMINGEAKPVTAFTGFQNPEDAEKLTALYIPAAVTIKDGALSNSPNLAKIEKTDVTESSVWTGLPGNLSRPGYHFIGWYAGDDKVENGSAISPDYPVAEPKFEAHSLTQVQEKEPTCTEEGTKAYYECSICKGKFCDSEGLVSVTDAELIIAPFGHDESGEWVTTDETNHWKVCSRCQTEILKASHDFTEYTEGEDDNWTRTCKVCGRSETAHHLKHKMEYHEAEDATCTEKGNIAYYQCTVCNKYFSDEEGLQDLTEEQVFIDATGHEMSYHAAVSETCTENGNIEYWSCSKCSKNFADENGNEEITGDVVIPAPGHELSHTEAKEPTCTEDGNIEYWYCSVCEKFFKDSIANQEISKEDTIIPELNHDYPENPTATDYKNDDDNHWLECSRCHKHFNEETHKYEVVYDFNSKTGALIATSKCEICGFEKEASSSSSTGAFDITTTFGVSAERLETNKWRISLDETYKDMFSGYVWTDSNGNEICEEIQGKDSFEIEVTETVGEDLMLMCHLYDDSGTEMEICFVTITR